MTKTQLIEALATHLGSTKSDCGKFVDGLTEVVTASLKTEGEVTVPGLVKIVLKDKAATEAHTKLNPFTRKMVDVPAKPASKKVAAKPLAALKKAIA